ncbi:hypothetical protein MATL_G00172640 [Megalops atlanticus]|uniref:Uncharacterized protein n=1 Tax=Megalops atlanticus TaxID=7932 RepID=A0A9D3PRF7_MEGAT|nr:hypothetical protein MATL_G00172640 [Megalops atlanticus]
MSPYYQLINGPHKRWNGGKIQTSALQRIFLVGMKAPHQRPCSHVTARRQAGRHPKVQGEPPEGGQFGFLPLGCNEPPTGLWVSSPQPTYEGGRDGAYERYNKIDPRGQRGSTHGTLTRVPIRWPVLTFP